MAQAEATHVFILRVWREPRELAGALAPWRGSVEHVPGGERRYLKEPGELLGVVLSYTGPWAPPEIPPDAGAGA